MMRNKSNMIAAPQTRENTGHCRGLSETRSATQLPESVRRRWRNAPVLMLVIAMATVVAAGCAPLRPPVASTGQGAAYPNAGNASSFRARRPPASDIVRGQSPGFQGNGASPGGTYYPPANAAPAANALPTNVPPNGYAPNNPGGYAPNNAGGYNGGG
ncbi:MAG: hypothetical protein AAFP90_15050, partial [Planctomycetota bacterium]